MSKVEIRTLEGPLKNLPLVVICEDLSDGQPFIKIIHSKGEKIAPAIPPETPEIEKIYGKAVKEIKNCEIVLLSSNILMSARLREGETVKIEPLKNNLFIYGTFLSKYYNFQKPEKPQVESGRIPVYLSKYKRIRAYIIGYKLYWPRGREEPITIISKHNALIGELYLDINKEDLKKLEEIFPKKGKKLIDHPIMPIDLNFSGRFLDALVPFKTEKKEVKMFPRDGVFLRQIGYKDIFPLNRGEVAERDEKRYFGIIQGNYPLILLALHEGYIIPSFAKIINRRATDMGTLAFIEKLALEIYLESGKELFPTIMYAKLHRSRCDLNRPIEEANKSEIAYEVHKSFHNLLEREIRRWRKQKMRVLILDIHGTRREQYDVYIRYRKKRERALEPFLKTLKRDGLKVRRSTLRTTQIPYGFYTLKRYDHGRGGTIVAQVELSIETRIREKIDHVVKTFQKALGNLYPSSEKLI